MPTQENNGFAADAAADPYDVPVRLSPVNLAFGWLLVGVPLVYGIISTLSKVGQLFQ